MITDNEIGISNISADSESDEWGWMGISGVGELEGD
jgi:hypothetical protein